MGDILPIACIPLLSYCMDDIENVKCIELVESENVSPFLHTLEEQEQIILWEMCRNNPDAMIQESFSVTCVLDNDRYKQPIIFTDQLQWKQCIALENSIILDDDTKCIGP